MSAHYFCGSNIVRAKQREYRCIHDTSIQLVGGSSRRRILANIVPNLSGDELLGSAHRSHGNNWYGRGHQRYADRYFRHVRNGPAARHALLLGGSRTGQLVRHMVEHIQLHNSGIGIER